MNTGSHVVCVLLFCFVLVNAKYFKYEDCSKNDGIAEISTFQIFPDPVSLEKNMSADVVAKILRDVPEDAVLKTRYYKLKSLFGIQIDVPIPCILGQFGSCTLSLCKYLDMFKDQAEGFFPEEYGCPVKAGEYGGKNVDVPIPDLPTLARIIVGGKYRTELSLLDKRGGKELACFKVWAEVY